MCVSSEVLQEATRGCACSRPPLKPLGSASFYSGPSSSAQLCFVTEWKKNVPEVEDYFLTPFYLNELAFCLVRAVSRV